MRLKIGDKVINKINGRKGIIIKPFKNSVVYITKMRDNRRKEVYEYIKICYIDIVSSSNYFILLPSFKEKTMYKNMIIDKEYNLMELNLE